MAISGVSGERIYHAPPRKLAVARFRPSQREDEVNVLFHPPKGRAALFDYFLQPALPGRESRPTLPNEG